MKGSTGRWSLRVIAIAYVGLLVALPVGFILYRALSPGLAVISASLTDPDAVHALVLTVVVWVSALALNTVFGVSFALLLVRGRLPFKALFDAFVDLPIALSPVVVGLALVLFYGRAGWLGPWLMAHGITVIFTPLGIVLASAFVSLPYVAREVIPVLIEVGDEQEQAAATLGARPFTIFRRITLPSIRWGVVYGVTVTTARILGEFGAVAVVSGAIVGQTETLTLLVDDRFNNLDTNGAYIAAVLLAVISVAVLALLSITKSQSRKEDLRWPSTPQESLSASATQ